MGILIENLVAISVVVLVGGTFVNLIGRAFWGGGGDRRFYNKVYDEHVGDNIKK